MTHERKRLRTQTLKACIVGACMCTSFSIGTAIAATSGLVYKGSVANPNGAYSDGCLIATQGTAPSMAQYATIRTYTNTAGCATLRVLGSGNLRVNARGYRSGAFCGETGYVSNPSADNIASVSSTLCTNPSGSQAFQTRSRGQLYNIWGGNAFTFSYIGEVASPSEFG